MSNEVIAEIRPKCRIQDPRDPHYIKEQVEQYYYCKKRKYWKKKGLSALIYLFFGTYDNMLYHSESLLEQLNDEGYNFDLDDEVRDIKYANNLIEGKINVTAKYRSHGRISMDQYKDMFGL